MIFNKPKKQFLDVKDKKTLNLLQPLYFAFNIG